MIMITQFNIIAAARWARYNITLRLPVCQLCSYMPLLAYYSLPFNRFYVLFTKTIIYAILDTHSFNSQLLHYLRLFFNSFCLKYSLQCFKTNDNIKI